MRNSVAIINSRLTGNAETRSLNGRPHIVVGMTPIVGDTAMNEIMYPNAELDMAFEQLNNLPAPDSHPEINGQFVSASHPLALNTNYWGAFIRSPKKNKSIVSAELWIDEAVANQTDRGKEIVEAINTKQKIGVSTGLLLNVEKSEGTDTNGAAYNFIGSDFQFDHVAILLDEEPAGQDTYLQNAKDQKQVFVCNMSPKMLEKKEGSDEPKPHTPKKNTETNGKEPEKMTLQEMTAALETEHGMKVVNAKEHEAFEAWNKSQAEEMNARRDLLETKTGLEKEVLASMSDAAVNALLDREIALEEKIAADAANTQALNEDAKEKKRKAALGQTLRTGAASNTESKGDWLDEAMED